MNDPAQIRDLGEARAVIADAVTEVTSAGFQVWGWDDERIIISDGGSETWVDPKDPERRPPA